MLKVKSWQTGIGLIAMALSAIVVLQLRTEFKIGATLPTRQVNELARIFSNQKMQLQKYENEISDLRKQLNDYDRDREIIRLKMAAGLVPLVGKGLRITLSDAERKMTGDDEPVFLGIVHYSQLELLINELWAAGAEAIAVNNYRIVGSTGLSCAGTTILVDTKRIAPPYIIDVIGDPKNLKNALLMPGGFVENEIQSFGLKFEIEQVTENEIRIPVYKGSISFEHAKLDEEQGK
ncbi:MAG: DUF881 domain-containing protein [Firmicutes bacterium]|nr:DUF881 domain-containing protein [Bacillota bacterium]